jgi:hypothetical protein
LAEIVKSEHDRRQIGRPRDGDERPCGLCGGSLRFQERHAVAKGSGPVPDPGHFRGRCQLRRKTGERIAVECLADANIMPGLHVATIAPRRVLRAIS